MVLYYCEFRRAARKDGGVGDLHHGRPVRASAQGPIRLRGWVHTRINELPWPARPTCLMCQCDALPHRRWEKSHVGRRQPSRTH